MIYGSVCSGIEAASVAWEPLGWRPAFFSEIEAFPRAVLAHRFPGVPLRGDFTQIEAGDHDAIDLLVGGTPCQSFSVAGLRGGLGDDRGNLALEYLRLADRLRPRWLVWENVPGVLSSGGGRDFGSILGGLGELGYGFAYRVLDAQYVRVDGHPRAVPQRRRRVFVVGHRGDWRRAAAVLLERESLQGNPPPRQKAGEGVAAHAGACPEIGGWPADVASTLNATFGEKQDLENQHALSGAPLFVPVALSLRGRDGGALPEASPDGMAPALRAADGGSSRAMVAFQTRGSNLDVGVISGTLGSNADRASGSAPMVASSHAVRRLTPRECERLQGFPDDWTLVPYRGRDAADGPRYKALGNSMAVNVMRWIGRRIEMVEGLA